MDTRGSGAKRIRADTSQAQTQEKTAAQSAIEQMTTGVRTFLPTRNVFVARVIIRGLYRADRRYLSGHRLVLPTQHQRIRVFVEGPHQHFFLLFGTPVRRVEPHRQEAIPMRRHLARLAARLPLALCLELPIPSRLRRLQGLHLPAAAVEAHRVFFAY